MYRSTIQACKETNMFIRIFKVEQNTNIFYGQWLQSTYCYCPAWEALSDVWSSRSVSVTVAERNKDVDDSIKKFLSNKKNYLIGLDIELSLSRDSEGVTRSKIAILTMCDARHCLIVQLPQLDVVPTSLFNFLQLPDYTFVGIDIARSIERLEKEYGFGCKNCADLRPMAAKRLSYGHMVQHLCGWRVYKPNTAVFDDWGNRYLNENQVEHAVKNVYAYREIGGTFLGF